MVPRPGFRKDKEHLGPLLAAALIVGMSKGGLASSAALAVPMLSLVMNPIEAAAILLPVYIGTDWIAVLIYRRTHSRRNLIILIPAMLAGIAIATLATPYMPERVWLVLTGLIGLWYVGRSWIGGSAAAPAEARIGPGLIWGTITGITSFITHSGAPPAQAFLLPQKLPKLEFAGTIAIAFAIGNLAKLPGYWTVGLLDALDLRLTLWLLAAGGLGTILGWWLVRLMPDRTYVRVIELFLLVLSILLLWKGIAAG